jgi:AraC family transcriptional regulator
MQSGTITIISKKEYHDTYASFSFDGIRIALCVHNDAKKFLDRIGPDLVLLDSDYSVDDGLQLLKEIKSMHPGIPIIFITDVASEDIVLKAFKNGARDFLKKPLNILELQEAVLGILSVRKGAHEKRRPFQQRSSRHEAFLKKVTTDQPDNLIHCIHYIHNNMQKDITLEELAKKANVSKYHFCRLFKKHIGISPMKFILSRKITRAKELLRREDVNISMIAADLGFSDLSSFSEKFKKLVGTSPTQFRKSLKKLSE